MCITNDYRNITDSFRALPCGAVTYTETVLYGNVTGNRALPKKTVMLIYYYIQYVATITVISVTVGSVMP